MVQQYSIKITLQATENVDGQLLRGGSTDMSHFMTGIHSEKCIVKGLCRCAKIIECTYTNVDGTAYHTSGLYGIPSLYT